MIFAFTAAGIFGIGPRLTSPSAAPARDLLIPTRTVVVTAAPALSPVAPAVLSLPERLRRFDSILFWLWGATSIVIGVAMVGLTTRARRLVANAEIGSMSNVPVRVTSDVGPALVGVVGYEIIVPRWCLSLAERDQSLIVEHEHQHAKAFDPALICLNALVILVFPWNFSLWYLMRRLRASIELDCDARVLAMAPDVHAYGTLLLKVGARSSSTPLFAAALGETASQLHRRLRAMSTRGIGISRSLIAISVGATVLLLAAAARAPRPEAVFAVTSHNAVAHPALMKETSSPKADTLRRIGYVSIRPIKGFSPVMVFTSGAARIGKGRDSKSLTSDTLYLNPPGMITADVTDGDVHVVSLTGGKVTVIVNFTNSPATHATMQFKHVVIIRGGVGVRGEVTPEDDQFETQTKVVADSIRALAWRVEPDAFDSRKAPGSSVIGLVVDEHNHVTQHSWISVADTTERLDVLKPRLFPRMKNPDDVPFQVMSVADGRLGSRSVQVVALFLEYPKYAPSKPRR
jgi:hypothetical protein